MDAVTAQAHDDRRSFERIEARFPSRFRDTSMDYGMDVFLRDFSASGLRVSTREKVFIDDVVSLEIKMPDDREPLVFNGRVRWVRPFMGELWEAGIEYHRISFMRVTRLLQFARAAQTA
jgi:hypothetical protein